MRHQITIKITIFKSNVFTHQFHIIIIGIESQFNIQNIKWQATVPIVLFMLLVSIYYFELIFHIYLTCRTLKKTEISNEQR
jgi:hypothetical protein